MVPMKDGERVDEEKAPPTDEVKSPRPLVIAAYVTVTIVIYTFLILFTTGLAYLFYHPLGAFEGLKSIKHYYAKPYLDYANPPANLSHPNTTRAQPLVTGACTTQEPQCPIEVCNCPETTPPPPCPGPPRSMACEAPYCPQGQCRHQVLCSDSPPPIELFRTADLLTKRIPEWINTYPPLSVERYEVVNTLLAASYDKWAIEGTLSHAMGSVMNPQSTPFKPEIKPCSMCTPIDRYNYIDCVVTNKIDTFHLGSVLQVQDSDTQHSWAQALLGHLASVGVTGPSDNASIKFAADINKLKPLMDYVRIVMDSYDVKTANGRLCRACPSFNATYYERCRRKFVLDRSKYTKQGWKRSEEDDRAKDKRKVW